MNVLLKQPFVFTEYQLNEYNIRKSQVQSIDNSQKQTQLKELHNNFINDISFINIGQVIKTTLEGIAKTQSRKVHQKLSQQQVKTNAKNIIGLVLHDALSNLAIRVTCGLPLLEGLSIQLHSYICVVYVVMKPFVLIHLLY